MIISMPLSQVLVILKDQGIKRVGRNTIVSAIQDKKLNCLTKSNGNKRENYKILFDEKFEQFIKEMKKEPKKQIIKSSNNILEQKIDTCIALIKTLTEELARKNK